MNGWRLWRPALTPLLLTAICWAGAVKAQGQSEQLEAAQGAGKKRNLTRGYRIVEGDIQVPASDPTDRPRATYKTNLWPNGNVYFEFDANVTPENQNKMKAAMAEWNKIAGVTWYARTNQANYIHIQDSDQNNSAVGMTGGQQIINITSWDRRFRMAHELGHALGLKHEQSRPNRDQFVEVTKFCKNVEGGCMGTTYTDNFPIDTGASAYGYYDFDSVMHYDQCSFSSNDNCPTVSTAFPDGGITIEVKEPFKAEWQGKIGQRDRLSYLDGVIMASLYPRGNSRFVDAAFNGPTSDGSFRRPYTRVELGIGAAPGGGVVWIQPGAYFAGGSVYRKPVTLRAPLGGVTIRQRAGLVGETLATLSAAGYNAELTAEAIASAFGENLAEATETAAALPLPTELAGTRVAVVGGDGVERAAPLFFVSPSQVNYLVPAGTPGGIATVVVRRGGAVAGTVEVPVTAVSPGLFSADSTGQGVAAAVALRVRADGSQRVEPAAQFDEAQGRFVAAPIDLGAEGDQVFLILFGTGFRSRTSPDAVSVTIGDESAAVGYAGPAPGFAGLDQINVALPLSLRSKGEVSVSLTADGRSANTVIINVR